MLRCTFATRNPPFQRWQDDDMNAIFYSRYGSPSVLKYGEIEKPVAGDHEVLIRVQAASVNPLDWHFMRGLPSLVRLMAGPCKPRERRLGVDVAGEVEAVGKDVTRFKPGDAVFGSCRGAFAEYVCTAEQALAKKPENLTFEQAASACVAGLTALQGLCDKGKIQAGQRVLINGAAGGVGTFAVQIAKSHGAEVTGVCSTRNLDMVRSIGADRVIDYSQEDFTRGGLRYDVVLDCIGNHSLRAYRRAMSPGAIHVSVGGLNVTSVGILVSMAGMLVFSRFVSQRFVSFMAKLNSESLSTLRGLMESGKVIPVIDRRYSLREVPEAIGYVEAGHARGKVVILVEDSAPAPAARNCMQRSEAVRWGH